MINMNSILYLHSLSAFAFPGKSNSILTTQRYHQDFACNFALEYYPFDNQVSTFILIVLYLFGLVPIWNFFKVCTMEFQIEGIKENWLSLQKDERGVDFQGTFI